MAHATIRPLPTAAGNSVHTAATAIPPIQLSNSQLRLTNLLPKHKINALSQEVQIK
jgi:hypothetical protein